ncbi:MAG: cell division protein FtsQ/DivIB [Solirubrobacterales bacterium]
MTGTASVALPAHARARIRILRRRAVVLLALAAAVFAAYTLWFRDSSLVAVKTVEITGLGESADAKRLEKALTAAAKEMTTLHLRHDALAAAARPFPLVREVKSDPTFPSSLAIEVVKRRPVAVIGDGAVAVAADGRILRGVPVDDPRLPALPPSSVPKGSWLEGPVRQQAQMLGAAPPALLRHVDHSFKGPSGIGVELEGGVDLLFAVPLRAAEKWQAAAAVLADPELGPLDYVDLTVPGRPAVGGVGHSPPPIASG